MTFDNPKILDEDDRRDLLRALRKVIRAARRRKRLPAGCGTEVFDAMDRYDAWWREAA